jgi:ATP-dependent DNA helicase PIF1
MTELINQSQVSSLELSAEQEIAFNKYINKENIFITGPGGAGKTELIRKIYKHAINNNKHIQVCALTGCAALLLRCKAKTIHSWSGIGLGAGTIEVNVDKVAKNYFKRKMWRETRLLIVDEVSMMSKKIFEMLDLIGKTIKKSNKPFGGIQLIFSGDFYQLPPVGNKDEPETGQFCFESEVWLNTFATANHIQLIKIFRQTDQVYSSILNQLREGRLKRSSVNILEKQVNKPVDNTGAIAMPTKLYPVRNKVEQINNGEMAKLTGDIKTYETQLLVNLPMTANEQLCRAAFTEDQIEAELNYIQNNLICDRDLQLKPGAQVMCIVNIELANGLILCNGSQGIVTRINELKLPVVRYNNGGEVTMTPHVWQSENIPGIGVSQIPLILSWALTIHKSQGATIDRAEIDVGSSVFECGQTYVALSRVKSLEGLYLTSFDINKIKINRKVRDFYAKINEAQQGALIPDVVSVTSRVNKVPEDIIKKEENPEGGDTINTVRVIKLY